MFKILFLILVVMSSTVFAQQAENSERKEKPKAYIFAELGSANDAEVKAKMEEFTVELEKDEAATGYFINYGNAKKVSKREVQIRNSLGRYCHDCRLVIVNGGESEELKTVFWVVPYGAEPPKP